MEALVVQLEELEALVILLLILLHISPCILLHRLIVPIGKCQKSLIKRTKSKNELQVTIMTMKEVINKQQK